MKLKWFKAYWYSPKYHEMEFQHTTLRQAFLHAYKSVPQEDRKQIRGLAVEDRDLKLRQQRRQP